MSIGEILICLQCSIPFNRLASSKISSGISGSWVSWYSRANSSAFCSISFDAHLKITVESRAGARRELCALPALSSRSAHQFVRGTGPIFSQYWRIRLLPGRDSNYRGNITRCDNQYGSLKSQLHSMKNHFS